MRYKSLDQKYDWQTKGNKELKCLISIIDKWTQMLFNQEIIITSAIRPKGDKPSYHTIGQAVDLRTKGVDEYIVSLWIDQIKMANRNLRNLTSIEGEFTWLHEDVGGDNQHFHLQLRKGEPI